ncbi:hypothetical protein Gekk315_00082 [Aeromonas phage Gekk3-15]
MLNFTFTDEELRYADPHSLSDAFRDQLSAYTKLRFIGLSGPQAAMQVGVEMNESGPWSTKADADPFVRLELSKLIAGIDIGKAWNAKTSMWRLITVIEDPYTKCSTKMAAIKELNVLSGVTFIDSKGNTRAGSLADFYAAQKDADAKAKQGPADGAPEPSA